MFRFRFKRRLIICGVVVNLILIVLFNVFYPKNTELLPDFSVNASKHFIQKFVPLKKKRVVSFEIGRPKPKETLSTCRFTQSEGLQAAAENYLYPNEDIVLSGKCGESSRSICTISGSVHSDNSIVVNCEENPCKDTVKFGSLNKETGEMQWEDVKSRNLETFIKSVGIKGISFLYPFFFLKCGEYINSSSDPFDFTQLVSMPILETRNQSLMQPAAKENINVNILFLNSVSRRHFYRSLPKTIEAFRMINLNPKSTSNVLDFELYQALNTARERGVLDFISGKRIKTGNSFAESLLNYFTDSGFQTLWQEDKCWKLSSTNFFNRPTSKDKLQKTEEVMKLNNINSIGMTHSSCFAFQENGVNTVKNYGQQNICVNGKLHHEYFLEFVAKYLGQVDSKKSMKPLFSLTSLNLGYEESGKHIQILDKSLASFVNKMAVDINTITFLLSDHGNTYNNFPVQTNEGQYEQYNPFMFVILPKFVERKLTESMKNNLLNNQISLTSIKDIYNTIKSLVEQKGNSSITHDQGLFKELESDRNCEKLSISPSSLCICDGWNSVQNANFFHYIVAEFALGQLNNMIVDQYLSHWSKHREMPFVTCEHLHGLKISNITQKRLENGYIEIHMNILVQRKEIFIVIVKWHGDNYPAMEMTLENYHRKTLGGETASCSASIDRELCICHGDKDVPNLKQYGSVFGRKSKSDNRHNHCLYILTRDYQESTVFEATNLCDKVEYHVQVNFELDNMRTPDIVPMNSTITPKSIRFLTFVTPLHLKKSGTWEYEITVTSVKRLKH